MKRIIKLIQVIVCLAAGLYTAQAQVKIGSNPTVTNPTSNLEVEGSVGSNISKVVVTKDSSKVGIGTIAPNNKLEINSGKPNTSGLRFTNLAASSPTYPQATAIGVTSNGDVVALGGATQVIRLPCNGNTYTGPFNSNAVLSYQAATFNTLTGATVGASSVTLPAGLYRAGLTIHGGFSVGQGSNVVSSSVWVNGVVYQLLASYSTPGNNGGIFYGAAIFELTSTGTVEFYIGPQVGPGNTFTLTGGGSSTVATIEKLR